MDNEAGYAEAYRDVIHEDAIRVGGAVKAPDYGFRIGGTRKFFLEAKKPAVAIRTDISPAYQLRRYAWSAKLPLSIISDFEEFAIYDCRVKPSQNDPASTARVFYCTYRELAEKWDWLASIFSRDGAGEARDCLKALPNRRVRAPGLQQRHGSVGPVPSPGGPR